MKKIWAIAWKDTFLTFTDRNLMLIMIATPLLISSIVGLAFGGFAGEGGPTFSDIPVAIVNQDDGGAMMGQPFDFGQQFIDMMIPSEDGQAKMEAAGCPLVEGEEGDDSGTSLGELVAATAIDSEEAAIEAVKNGDYVAAIIIPPDYTERLLAPDIDNETQAVSIRVIGDSGRPIFAFVIHSIVDGFNNRMLTGNIAIAANTGELGLALLTNPEIGAYFSCGFYDVFNTVNIDPKSVNPDEGGLSGFAEILVMIGVGQATFFALFTGQAGVLSIVEERRTWTLQRLIISPTSRAEILAGKLVGTAISVIFQISLLLIALLLIASLGDGQFSMIWGNNLLAIAAMVLAISVSVCGFGVFVAGIVKTPEGMNSIGVVFNMILAMVGGAFGADFGDTIPKLSLIFWSSDGLSELSAGGTDIMLHLVFLTTFGIITFIVGLWLFERRADI
jgi:ABC-2 type transport system permease protein